MKKILWGLIGLGSFVALYMGLLGTSYAISPTQQALGGTGTSTVFTSHSLILQGTSGYAGIAPGTDGYFVRASSTAPLGYDFAAGITGLTVLNGLVAGTQNFTASSSGSILGISSSGSTHTFTITLPTLTSTDVLFGQGTGFASTSPNLTWTSSSRTLALNGGATISGSSSLSMQAAGNINLIPTATGTNVQIWDKTVNNSIAIDVNSISGQKVVTFPNVTGNVMIATGTLTSGNCLQATGSSTVATTNAACGSGGGTPGSPIGSVQFNVASTLTGSSNFLWDNGAKSLIINNATPTVATLMVEASSSAQTLPIFNLASSTGSVFFQGKANGDVVISAIASGTPLTVNDNNAQPILQVSASSTLPYIFHVQNSGGGDIFYVATSSRVGIGTSTPQATFNIQGSAGVTPFTITSSTGTSLLDLTSVGNLILSNAAKLQARTSTGTVIDIAQINGSNDAFFLPNISNGIGTVYFGYNSPVPFVMGGTCCGGALPTSWTFNSSGATSFQVNSADKMTLASTGRVGIGTTTPIGTLSVVDSKASIRVGEPLTDKVGCIEIYGSNATTTLFYMYAISTSPWFQSTSTKPSFCQ